MVQLRSGNLHGGRTVRSIRAATDLILQPDREGDDFRTDSPRLGKQQPIAAVVSHGFGDWSYQTPARQVVVRYGRIGEQQALAGARGFHDQCRRQAQTPARVDLVQSHGRSEAPPAGPVRGMRNPLAVQECAFGEASRVRDAARHIGTAHGKNFLVAQLLDIKAEMIVEASVVDDQIGAWRDSVRTRPPILNHNIDRRSMIVKAIYAWDQPG